MPRNQTAGTLALAGFDDIFSPTGKVLTMRGEQIVELPLPELFPPDFHPFQINDDAEMERLAESVKEYGVREPGLVRPRADGGYELLVGNRRKRACELAGKANLPVIIRELTDDEAAIIMVDSNLLHRERILPSEKAWAYHIEMEALNHSGVRGRQHSYQVMEAKTGEKKNQIFRYIRLTELIDALLDKVDANKLAFNPAVELSYLSIPEQTAVADAMARYEVKPSLSQAVRLKKLKQDGTLTTETIDAVLSEDKKLHKGEPAGSLRFRRFFPPEYSPKQMETVIIGLLADWKARVAG
ncbi:MAG: ParB/RepB/Spo0J family partition protein [Oscillospiraceae bacterium]|jgi:ParB family chromosome partitioning protein|nr:ParB/RepB/Spo0J family partition protein [Oscillospiraceae bacterium]